MMLGHRFAVPALVIAATLLLTGCVAESPTPVPTSTGGATPAPSPSATPQPDPELVPEGSAEDNLPYFNFLNAPLLADGNPGGRAIIDKLVAAGFDKSAMQVTADKTPRGVAVDSLQFSVQIGDECLLGQAGVGGYTSVIARVFASGGCLPGRTRPIDW